MGWHPIHIELTTEVRRRRIWGRRQRERRKNAKDRDLKVPTGKAWEDEGRCKLDTIIPRKAENMESQRNYFF